MRTSLRSDFALALLCCGLAGAQVGCDKPTDNECRVAIQNMRKLLTTDKVNTTNDVESAVRRCRGSSSKKSVQCAASAATVEDLKACGLLPEVKDEPPAGKTDKK